MRQTVPDREGSRLAPWTPMTPESTDALQSVNAQWPAILHYASRAAFVPISQGRPVTPPSTSWRALSSASWRALSSADACSTTGIRSSSASSIPLSAGSVGQNHPCHPRQLRHSHKHSMVGPQNKDIRRCPTLVRRSFKGTMRCWDRVVLTAARRACAFGPWGPCDPKAARLR
jgi:hypothetical protein